MPFAGRAWAGALAISFLASCASPAAREKTSLYPWEQAEVQLRAGNEKMKAKDWDGALAAYAKALECDPGNPDAHTKLGTALVQMRRFEDAIEEYTKVLKLRPDPLAYSNRARVFREMHDPRGALSDYSAALSLDPKHVPAYISRGSVREELGDFEGAVGDYGKAIDLDPGNLTALASRARARAHSGNLAGASADCSRILEIAPVDWPQRLEIEELQKRTGREHRDP